MRFFLDSGSAEEARRIKDLGLLDGVWLSLAAAEEAGSEYRKAIRDLASLTDGPVLRSSPPATRRGCTRRRASSRSSART